MNRNRKKLLALSLSATLGAVPLLLHAQEPAQQRTLGSVERSHASQARGLLDQAVLTFQAKGPEQALAAFNDRSGEFVHGQYYIFVLGEDGTMQASSGPSASLVGLNVADLKDASGKSFIREILDKSAKQDSGDVEYKWLNPPTTRSRTRSASSARSATMCSASAITSPRHRRACQGAARPRRAAGQGQGAEAAFRSFNDPRGGRLPGRVRLRHRPGRRSLPRQRQLAEPGGRRCTQRQRCRRQALFKEMIELARKQGSGTVDYVWRNPATNAVEQKHADPAGRRRAAGRGLHTRP